MKPSIKLIISSLCVAIFAGKLLAQGEAAVPMLYLNPSPQLNGLGMVGTSIPTNDPFGFYYNPAQLGYTSQTNNLSFQFNPSDNNWIPRYFSLTYKNISFNIGYNFEKMLNGIKLSAGFGYIHSKMDYTNSIGVSSYYPRNDIYDEFNAYGFGIGIDYYIQLNIGLTYKKIRSVLGPPIYSNLMIRNYEATPSTIDYGFLLIVPVIKLIDPKYNLFTYHEFPASPYFNISIGYARLNQGGEAVYVDQAQADPLPRTARLGYTLNAGLDQALKTTSLKVIDYNFTVEADDILIERNSVSYSYQSGIGDIQIWKNLIELKGNGKVVIHKGHKFELFETVSYMTGRFDGHGYYSQKSSGIGVRLKGIFKLMKANLDDNYINYIADHFDIQYYSTKLFKDSPIETSLEGLGIVYSGFFF